MPLHPEVESFLRGALSRFGRAPRSVLEVGSLIMHDHDPRPLFLRASYLGLDGRPGPGVDQVVRGVLDWPGAIDADCFLCLQVLEHDPFRVDTLDAGIAALAPGGGLIVVTCAGPGARPHEHMATPVPGFYSNASAHMITSIIEHAARAQRLEIRWLDAEYRGAPGADGPGLRTCVAAELVPTMATGLSVRVADARALARISGEPSPQVCALLYSLAHLCDCGEVVTVGDFTPRGVLAIVLGAVNRHRLLGGLGYSEGPRVFVEPRHAGIVDPVRNAARITGVADALRVGGWGKGTIGLLHIANPGSARRVVPRMEDYDRLLHQREAVLVVTGLSNRQSGILTSEIMSKGWQPFGASLLGFDGFIRDGHPEASRVRRAMSLMSFNTPADHDLRPSG